MNLHDKKQMDTFFYPLIVEFHEMSWCLVSLEVNKKGRVASSRSTVTRETPDSKLHPISDSSLINNKQ